MQVLQPPLLDHVCWHAPVWTHLCVPQPDVCQISGLGLGSGGKQGGVAGYCLHVVAVPEELARLRPQRGLGQLLLQRGLCAPRDRPALETCDLHSVNSALCST